MTRSQRLQAIDDTANEALPTGNRLRTQHGIAFTLPTFFVNDADKHDIATLVHSRSSNTVRFNSISTCSISFRLVY